MIVEFTKSLKADFFELGLTWDWGTEKCISESNENP